MIAPPASAPTTVPGVREGLAFAVAFVLALVVGSLADPVPFVYDAAHYWGSAAQFTVDGHWSLWNFSDSLRGYVPGLMYYGVSHVGEFFGLTPNGTVNLFNALLFATITAVLAPRFARLAWPQFELGFGRRLVLIGLFIIFWRGYLNHPLADFPALVAALAALIAVSRVSNPLMLLLAGLAVGLSVDLRPAYVLLIPAILVLAFWNARSIETPFRPRRHVGNLLIVVIGIAIVLVPQGIVNHKHHAVWNPLPGAPAELTGFQLQTGLVLQRYETYVGPEDRSPALWYADRNTEELAAEIDRDGGIKGYGDYLRIAVENPVTIAGVFLRHLVNGMDQRYTSTYVSKLDTGQQRPLRIAAMLIAFLALLRVAWPAARRSLGTARWRYPLALLATCVTILPSAVETRFLLPLYLLTYLLVLAPGWPIRSAFPRHGEGVRGFATPVAITVGFVAFAAIWWYIVTETGKSLL